MRAARIDATQKEIVAYLREHGCTVQHLHQVGGGCPDLLVGYAHNGKPFNVLLEVKDVGKEEKLTPQQVIWHAGWRGQKAVVSNKDQALQVVIEYAKQ